MKKNILWASLCALVLVGCATSSSYINYTQERFAPKDRYYAENVYPDSQALAATNPYYVIGKVAVEGFASNGVSPQSLTSQAKVIARKRGADAIINARTVAYHYYGDELFRFKGELIVYAPAVSK